MTNEVLLCSDLDRTIIPNGPQPESPRARPLLRAVAERPELTLSYVTGRHRALLIQALEEYELPIPDYAIGDVGTTIYEIEDGRWHLWERWSEEIAVDWRGCHHDDLQRMFSDLELLRLQESEKQNVFKLSYYAPADIERQGLLDEMNERLDAEGIRASLIWSIDEMKHVGLLDVLPKRATKKHAIEFLMKNKGFGIEQTVFAGDSGNDLPALTSGLQAVLVKNAIDEVRNAAVERAEANGCRERLYLAQGGFLGMNGNYSAGVLEGLVHFLPHTLSWLESA
ncbi:MAG: haloacid dehalogenase [Myxococcales bacterium SG8_38]|nr:MAG: haloacid dehalogenase [Myxococcales bacterium SG8_38]